MTALPLDDFTANTIPPDFRRDQWQRPSIMQPDGRRKGYTRCSSAAKTIEDTFNLEKWARRNIAYGMAYDASLVARVIAIGGEPSTWDKAAKDEVNAILDAANAVAKAHKRADIGTAVHHLTHRVDRGEDVNAGPYTADIEAYQRALYLHGLTPVPELIECRMVNDDLEMAGTTDRIFPNGRELHYIADIKTGRTMDFGGLGWAAQLAAYAGGVLYDVVNEVRLPTPPIDRNVGLIIHLPAGEGRCDIYEVDIVQGLVAARLANDIRRVRKESKTWIVPAKYGVVPERMNGDAATEGSERAANATTTPPGVQIPPTPRRAQLLARYQAMSDDEKLAYMALGVPRDADEDTIERALDSVDRFNVVVEPPPTVQELIRAGWASNIVKALPPDEGGPVADTDVRALEERYEALGLDAKLWTGTLVAQGNKAFPFRIRDRATVRRYELYRGILALAEVGFG